MTPVEFPDRTGHEPCTTGDPDRFHPEREIEQVVLPVIAECAGCPIREGCLTFALAYGEIGIWGGTTTEERRRMRRNGTALVPFVRRSSLDRALMIAAHERGVPDPVIARMYGIDPQSVNQMISRYRHAMAAQEVAVS